MGCPFLCPRGIVCLVWRSLILRHSGRLVGVCCDGNPIRIHKGKDCSDDWQATENRGALAEAARG